MAKIRQTVYVEKSLLEKLKAIAHDEGKSFNAVAVDAWRQFINRKLLPEKMNS